MRVLFRSLYFVGDENLLEYFKLRKYLIRFKILERTIVPDWGTDCKGSGNTNEGQTRLMAMTFLKE